MIYRTSKMARFGRAFGTASAVSWMVSLAYPAVAAPIALDTTFGNQGVLQLQGGSATGIAAGPSGKFVVAGSASGAPVTGSFALQFKADGTVDTSYGASGYGVLPNAAGKIAVDKSGRVVNSRSQSTVELGRLAANGSVDGSFGTGGVSTVLNVGTGTRFILTKSPATDASNRIVVPGVDYTESPIETLDPIVVRATATGALDTTFGTGGVFRFIGKGSPSVTAGNIFAAGHDSKGRVIAAGSVARNDGSMSILVARLTTAGKLDPTFGNGGLAFPINLASQTRGFVGGVAFDGDAVIVGGSIDPLALGVPGNGFVAKLDAAGSLVPGFGQPANPGVTYFPGPADGSNFTVNALTVDDAGRPLLLANGTDSSVFRFTPQGLPDADFDGDGSYAIQLPGATSSSGLTAGILASGQRVYVAGSVPNSGGGNDFAVVALANPVVNMSVSDYTATGTETALSQTAPHYTIKLSNAVKVPVTVNYDTRNGTAYAARDYTAIKNKVVFNPGETEKTITVPVLDDTLTEGNETFDFRLTSASLGTITTPFVTTTIQDDDQIIASDSNFTTAAGVPYSGVLSTTSNPGWTYSIVNQPTLGSVSLNTSTGEYTYTAPVSLGGNDSFTFRISDGTAFSNTATVSITVTANELPSLVVTTLSDTVAIDGQTSLREAINYAAQHDGPDDITFAPGLSGVIKLASSLPPLTWGSVTGPGPDLLTIDAQLSVSQPYDCRIFTVNTEDLVQIRNLKMSGGSSANGGAIYGNAPDSNFSRVEVYNCVFIGNKATLGGAVYNVRNIDGCSFNNNQSTSNGAGYFGPTSGTTTITNSTFENNLASGWGGGIYSSQSVSVWNSTFFGNKANGHGGAILTAGGKVLHCTITGNQADANGNNDGSGGGIYRVGAAATPALSIYNCIVSGNTAASGPDFFGTFNTIQYTLIGNGSGPTGIGAGNFLNVDPKFDPAGTKDNGGATRTIALQANSPAINHGDKTQDAALTYDQRGSGFPRLNGGETDMGAVEMQTNQVPVAQDAILVVKPGFTSVRATLSATDADGQPLTYQIVTQPRFGTLGAITGGATTFTPNGDYAGFDQFTFKVNDGVDDSNVATVTIKYNSAPELISLTPAKADGSVTGSGGTSLTGEPLKLTLVVSDEDGADKLRMAYALFNKSQTNGNGVSLSYDVAANKLFMRSSDGKTVLGGEAPGASVAPLDNGLATLDYSASTVVRDGKTLTITFVVTPKASFAGLKKLWASVRDAQGEQVDFTPFGSWTVNPSAAPAFKAPSGGDG